MAAKLIEIFKKTQIVSLLVKMEHQRHFGFVAL